MGWARTQAATGHVWVTFRIQDTHHHVLLPTEVPYSQLHTLVTRMSQALKESGRTAPTRYRLRPEPFQGQVDVGKEAPAVHVPPVSSRPSLRPSPHSPVLPRLSRSLLGHQDVVLLGSVLLPVGELRAFALTLLDETYVSRGADAAGTPRAPCHTHPEQGDLFLLLVVEVFLDVEKGIKEHVGEFTLLKIMEGDLPCRR